MSEASPGNQLEDPTLLLWADCEFTGLRLEEGHKIIEIAAVVTDLALREIDAYESFIDYDWTFVDGLMLKNPWWQGRDIDRSRMQRGMLEGKPVAEVDADLSDLVDAYFPDSQPALSGNSIGSDKLHIDAELPDFASRLSYQVLDVSSLKRIALDYRGIEYTGKKHLHHALSDTRESIDEFRFLLTGLGITDFTEFARKKTS